MPMGLSTLCIALRNLGRNKRRTLLAVGAVALGQLTLVFVNGLVAASFHEMIRTVTGPLVGHVQIQHKDWRQERAIDLSVHPLSAILAELNKLPSVRSVSPRIYAPVLAASGEKKDEPADAEPAMVLGIDVTEESQEEGLLEFVQAEELPSEGTVVVGKVLASRLNLKSGQTIAVIGQDADGFPASDLFEIAAIIDSSVDVVKSTGIVMSLEDASKFLVMPDQAHQIIVRGSDFRKADALSDSISALESLSAAEVLSWRQAMPELLRFVKTKAWFDAIFLVIVFGAAAAGIANTAMMSAFERTHEFGMLLAVGARPTRVVRMVLIESVIVGLIGVAIGSVLGTSVVLITSRTGINYAALGGVQAEDVAFAGISFSLIVYPRFELQHVLYGVVGATVTSVLASLWPALVAARLEPTEAMRS
jgi:putative ABC transport system permease protein